MVTRYNNTKQIQAYKLAYALCAIVASFVLILR